MELSPEERRKIYEEEKARVEAREQLDRERQGISGESSVNLRPNVAGLLCYLGAWITGIIFIVLEQKNRWIRFHAAQSIVTFGSLWIAGMVFGWIPILGPVFSAILGITGFVLWIVLMVKAYHGERYRVPWAADLAEMIIGSSGRIPDYQPPPPPPTESKEMPPPPPPPPPAASAVDIDEKISRKVDDALRRGRELRITGHAFAIAWCIVLIVFFNFFHQYAAYYDIHTGGGVFSWTKDSFFTSDIKTWLPILNTALAISIICHIVIILVNKNILRQALHVIMDGFGLATVITLLVVFPFDFNVIPNDTAAAGANLGVTIALVCIAVGFGIGLVVRLIKLLVSIGKAVINTADAD